MKHYEYEINLFADGELEETIQPELLAHLAECPACRKVYNQTLFIKAQTNSFCRENVNSIKAMPVSKKIDYKYPFYASAVISAAALILIVVITGREPKTVQLASGPARVDTVYIPQAAKSVKLAKELRTVQAKGENLKSYLRYVMSLPAEMVNFKESKNSVMFNGSEL